MSVCFAGVGLRSTHYSFLEEGLTSKSLAPSWFEAISENYMDTEGRPLEVLLKIREKSKIALHGVSLSIGSIDPLNETYLEKLNVLIERVDPFIVSDHMCWTGAHGQNLHDLLPLPFRKTVINHLTERIDLVQNRLKRPIALENVSTYLRFRENDFTEWDFLNEVTARSGCQLLLDINNVYVNSQNHGFDPYLYLDKIDRDRVAQIHLGGFSDMGDFLFDTHSKPVHETVWQLFAHFISRKPDQRYG
jgi:uncharacterized protein